MNISGQTKLLLLIAGILIFILVLNNYNSNPIKNKGNLILDENINDNDEQQILQNIAIRNKIPQNDLVITNDLVTDQINVMPKNEIQACSNERIRRKFKSKNRAKPGQYKKISYAEGERGNGNGNGNGSTELDEFFDANNNIVGDVYASDDTFGPNDETNGNLATYNPGRRNRLADEDIFNVENYLPQEHSKDWFEVMPDPVSVKNRHLINISRPVGINTIGNSLKNPSYDIRGTPPNPKFVASPWLQSSIEPDIGSGGLC